MTFSKDGSIGDIKVIQGLGYGLTEQAIAAAKQIVFQPKQINGVPVSVTKTVEYNFNIY
jgi:TonB family protein